MTAFTVHSGGRPPIDPPGPPRPVDPPTAGQIASLERRIRFAVDRSPQLWAFLEHLVFMLDGKDAEYLEAIARVLRGQWNSDRGLATTIAGWPSLPRWIKDAIQRLAIPAPAEAPYVHVRSAIADMLRTAPPDAAAEIVGAVTHNAARRPGDREGRIAAIAATLHQMTDDEIAVIGPLIAAVVGRGQHRAAHLRSTVTRALRHLFSPNDWASLAVSAIRQLRAKE